MQRVAKSRVDEDAVVEKVEDGIDLIHLAGPLSAWGRYKVSADRADGEGAAQRMLSHHFRENPRTIDHARDVIAHMPEDTSPERWLQKANEDLARVHEALSALPVEHRTTIEGAINAAMRIGYALASSKLSARHYEVVRRRDRLRGKTAGSGNAGVPKGNTKKILVEMDAYMERHPNASAFEAGNHVFERLSLGKSANANAKLWGNWQRKSKSAQ